MSPLAMDEPRDFWDSLGKPENMVMVKHRLAIISDLGHVRLHDVALHLDDCAIKFENKPVLVYHGLKTDLQQIWRRMKDWD